MCAWAERVLAMACILTFALLALDGPSRPERIASAAGALGPISHQKSKSAFQAGANQQLTSACSVLQVRARWLQVDDAL